MKPPACVRCKWGTGTTCERPPVAKEEIKSNFEKMMAERAKQDANWFPESIKGDQTKSVSSPSNDPGMLRK